MRCRPAFRPTSIPPSIFPVYYLRHLLPLPYGLMILGAVHGLNLLLIYFLTRVLLERSGDRRGRSARPVLIAAVGPMTLSEVETSFSDILTALPIVTGFNMILSADGSRHGRYVLAGLLIGAAVGLKLTNVVYALGAAAAVLAATRPLRATLCLGVGGAMGALATGGAWGLMLWRELGNPIFPLFNAVFRSPELVPMNIMDWQFSTPRLPRRSRLSVLLADRRQQELGVSVSRCAICRRDGVDPARHRPVFSSSARSSSRSGTFSCCSSFPSPMRRSAHPVCESALCHRAGAIVRAGSSC